MKVLFLDIDGVLNIPAAELGWREVLGSDFKPEPDTYLGKFFKDHSTIFCPSSLYNLHRIVEATNCKIVISSTWRHGEEVDEMKSWFPNGLIQSAVIDKTPDLDIRYKDSMYRVSRGLEISVWVKHYKKIEGQKSIESFAIVDDDSDMWPEESNFFQTDGYIGLDWGTADKIIKHLNEDRSEPGIFGL